MIKGEYKTRIEDINARILQESRDIILAGGLVAFPTETVYGLGAYALDTIAVEKIFAVKGRPSENPLIVHVGNKDMISLVAEDVSREAEKVIDRLMPGSITVVLKKRNVVPGSVTAGLDTVAVRIPSSEDSLSFLKACGVPVAAPSANKSGRPSPTRPEDVYEDLKGFIPLILKGTCKVGIESTVIDLSGKEPIILRQGIVSAEEIESTIERKTHVLKNVEAKINSPGVRFQHYVPLVPLFLCLGNCFNEVKILLKKESNPVVLCMDALAGEFSEFNTVKMGISVAEYANKLFAALRDTEKKYSTIVAVFTEKGNGAEAVINRLEKASQGKII